MPNYSRDYRGYLVHTLPPHRPTIADAYGLWIFKTRHHASTPPGTVERPRFYEHYSISHLLSDTGFYWTPESGCQRLTKGQAVVITPGMVHNFGSEDALYVEDSISFYGLVADKMFESGIIRPGVVDLGVSRRLLPILELAADPAENAQIEACFALQSLLTVIWRKRWKSARSKHKGIDELISAIRHDLSKWWTAEMMAERCDLKPSRFREVFRDAVGMSPKRYVDELKMEEACRLLQHDSLSIAEIGECLGYLDPFHFSRRFKTLMGESPQSFRTNNLL